MARRRDALVAASPSLRMREVGIKPAAAFPTVPKAWLTWGETTAGACVGFAWWCSDRGGGGCRLPGGAHAWRFAAGAGGNQGDQVNVRAFEQYRVVGY